MHSVTDAVAIVFRLDNGDGHVRLVVQDVVGSLRLTARHELSTNDNSSLGKRNLFADLRGPIPSALLKRGADELGTNVALAEVFLLIRLIESVVPCIRSGPREPGIQVKTMRMLLNVAT